MIIRVVKKNFLALSATIDDTMISNWQSMPAELRPFAKRGFFQALTESEFFTAQGIDFTSAFNERRISSFATSIANDIADPRNFRSIRFDETYEDRYRVTVRGSWLIGAGFLNVTVEDLDGRGLFGRLRHTAVFVTNRDKMEQLLENYINQMWRLYVTSLEISANEALKSLTHSVSRELSDELNRALENAGFGNINDTIGTARSFTEVITRVHGLNENSDISSWASGVSQAAGQFTVRTTGVAHIVAGAMDNMYGFVRHIFNAAVQINSQHRMPQRFAPREPNINVQRINSPVDVFAYDSQNNLLGSIQGPIVNVSSPDIFMHLDGNVKIVESPADMPISLRIVATGYGSMNYVSDRFEDYVEVERANFFNVYLERGREYFVDLAPVVGSNNLNNLRIVSGETILPDEVFNFDNPTWHTIQVIPETGGIASGTNRYRSGDLVSLSAVPDEDYTFAGWFMDNEVVSFWPFLHFIATEDATLEAQFIPDRIYLTIVDDIEYADEGSAQYLRPFRPGFGTSPAQPPPTPIPATPTPTPPQMPDNASLSEALFKLGLFVGTGTDTNGNPIFELERQPTRLEALALVVRLMGLQQEAMTFTGTNNFTDVPAWGAHYAAYGYHIGLTVGTNDDHTEFTPNRQVTAHEFTTFLLRVLGYSEANGDFLFEEAMQKASIIGFFSPFDITWVSTDNFLRYHAIHAMTNALLTIPKDSNEYLLHRLVGQGVFSREDADWFIENISS